MVGIKLGSVICKENALAYELISWYLVLGCAIWATSGCALQLFLALWSEISTGNTKDQSTHNTSTLSSISLPLPFNTFRALIEIIPTSIVLLVIALVFHTYPLFFLLYCIFLSALCFSFWMEMALIF